MIFEVQKLLIVNSSFYLAIFLLIGVPIWYFTTSTYRASLPFNEIDDVGSMLLNNQLELRFDFEIIQSRDERSLNDFNEKFQNEMNKG